MLTIVQLHTKKSINKLNKCRKHYVYINKFLNYKIFLYFVLFTEDPY